jgi:hypothetical protein
LASNRHRSNLSRQRAMISQQRLVAFSVAVVQLGIELAGTADVPRHDLIEDAIKARVMPAMRLQGADVSENNS